MKRFNHPDRGIFLQDFIISATNTVLFFFCYLAVCALPLVVITMFFDDPDQTGNVE